MRRTTCCFAALTTICRTSLASARRASRCDHQWALNLRRAMIGARRRLRRCRRRWPLCRRRSARRCSTCYGRTGPMRSCSSETARTSRPHGWSTSFYHSLEIRLTSSAVYCSRSSNSAKRSITLLLVALMVSLVILVSRSRVRSSSAAACSRRVRCSTRSSPPACQRVDATAPCPRAHDVRTSPPFAPTRRHSRCSCAPTSPRAASTSQTSSTSSTSTSRRRRHSTSIARGAPRGWAGRASSVRLCTIRRGALPRAYATRCSGRRSCIS